MKILRTQIAQNTPLIVSGHLLWNTSFYRIDSSNLSCSDPAIQSAQSCWRLFVWSSVSGIRHCGRASAWTTSYVFVRSWLSQNSLSLSLFLSFSENVWTLKKDDLKKRSVAHYQPWRWWTKEEPGLIANQTPSSPPPLVAVLLQAAIATAADHEKNRVYKNQKAVLPVLITRLAARPQGCNYH